MLFGISDPRDQQWVDRRMTVHPWSTWTDPLRLKNPFGAGLPKHYIECTSPSFPLLNSSRERLRVDPAGWTRSSIAASHDAMVTAPLELANALMALG